MKRIAAAVLMGVLFAAGVSGCGERDAWENQVKDRQRRRTNTAVSGTSAMGGRAVLLAFIAALATPAFAQEPGLFGPR